MEKSWEMCHSLSHSSEGNRTRKHRFSHFVVIFEEPLTYLGGIFGCRVSWCHPWGRGLVRSRCPFLPYAPVNQTDAATHAHLFPLHSWTHLFPLSHIIRSLSKVICESTFVTFFSADPLAFNHHNLYGCGSLIIFHVVCISQTHCYLQSQMPPSVCCL